MIKRLLHVLFIVLAVASLAVVVAVGITAMLGTLSDSDAMLAAITTGVLIALFCVLWLITE